MNAKEKRPKHQRLRRFLSLVGEDGFEPSKRNATDLQSAPFGHSGILPYEWKQNNGAGGRTRTPDLLITNQLLYQLSYTSEFSFRSCIHSLISSAYIIYHILHHLSTLFSNFFNFFEAFSFFEDVLEWVSLTIISSPTLFVKGFCKKIFHCIFQQNILWIFCRSVAKLQTFRFTAKLNSLLLSARTI